MRIEIFSFGFKNGPAEADYIFDLRFLPNPYWVPELRPFPGTDSRAASYVLTKDDTREFLQKLQSLLGLVCQAWAERGDKERLRIGLGCTGGYHRSVAITEYLAAWLQRLGYEVDKSHRDMENERYLLKNSGG